LPNLTEAIASVARSLAAIQADGPKPPASACPADGGRFSPAGAGNGLWRDCGCSLAKNGISAGGERQWLS